MNEANIELIKSDFDIIFLLTQKMHIGFITSTL